MAIRQCASFRATSATCSAQNFAVPCCSCSYRIYATHRLLRRCSVKRIKDKLKTYRRQFAEGEIGVAGVQQKIQSWLGHAGHANTYHLRQQLLAQPFTRREGMDDANTDIHL